MPICFTDQQRQAVIDAGEIVGLRVAGLISDTSAGVAQIALDPSKSKEPTKSLVFDFGAGHCQAAVLEMKPGGKIEVLGSSGDPYIGGEDFDNVLLDHFLKELRLNNKDAPNLRKNAKAMRQLQFQCEKAKKLLGTNETCKLGADGKGLNFVTHVNRAKFRELSEPLLAGILDVLDDALQDAELDRTALDKVYLMGGSSSLRVVRELLGDYFSGLDLDTSLLSEDASHAVAKGAAIKAMSAVLDVKDITSVSIGVGFPSGMMTTTICERGTRLPAERKHMFSTFPCKGDQVVLPIHVYEGDEFYTKDNDYLGKFEVVDFNVEESGKLLEGYSIKSQGSQRKVFRLIGPSQA